MMIKMQFGDPSLDNHFFEKNLVLLKDHVSWPAGIHNELSKKITVLNANSGKLTVQYKNILLHSKYDPKNEILTDQLMYSYLRNLEQISMQNKNTRIYNLCSQGATIDSIDPLYSISELKRWFS